MNPSHAGLVSDAQVIKPIRELLDRRLLTFPQMVEFERQGVSIKHVRGGWTISAPTFLLAREATFFIRDTLDRVHEEYVNGGA